MPDAADKTSLPPALADALLDAVAPIEPSPDARASMLATLKSRVAQSASADLKTVAGADGEWLETVPGNQVKILRQDDQSMSILVRLAPGTTFPAHSHPADEETYVLEGETRFGDIELSAGDYHFAPKGTEHGEVTTETGCTLFIRKASD